MKWESFQSKVPGKWVLAGEHAVLRGAAAIALPHPELGLSLRFEPGPAGGGIEVLPSEGAEPILEIIAALPEAGQISGRLEIESTIPWGAGLGSSAALCVALARWFSGPLGLSAAALPDFATKLENRFHGKSSGMDIAVILAGEPVRFLRGQNAVPLGIRRLPKFTFHDTGLRARTSLCVAQVEVYLREHAERGAYLDQLMGCASREAEEGLSLYGSGQSGEGLRLIAQAMARGQQCFEAWGLFPDSVRGLRQDLLERGALAAKLTGAGGGGMLVALWDDPDRARSW